LFIMLCSTIKSECPVYVRLLATHVHKEPVLKVIKTELEHNHSLSPELNSMLPQNRRLSSEQQADVAILVT